MSSLSTKLRHLSSTNWELIEEMVNSLSFKVEIKSHVFDGERHILTFVIPDGKSLEGGNVYNINKSVKSDSDGYFEVELPVIESGEAALIITTITFTDSNDVGQKIVKKITVPNQSTAKIDSSAAAG